MKKTEILAEVLSRVTEATEVDASVIVSRSRKEEHVEARMIVVYCCIRKGLRPVQVAELMGQTAHNIYRTLNEVKDRYAYSSSFRYDCDFVCKQLGLTCDIGGK